MGKIIRAAVVLCFVPAFAAAQEPEEKDPNTWKGETILGKWPAKKTHFWEFQGDKRIELKLESEGFFVVLGEDKEAAKIKDRVSGKEGWVSKASFVLRSEALVYFTGRIESDGKDAHALKNRARLYAGDGKRDNAIKDLTAAIKSSSQDSDAYFLRFHAYLANSEFDKAIADGDQLVELVPGKVWPLLTRAEARVAKKDFAGAKKDFEAALEIDAKNPSIHLARAEAHRAAKDFKAEIADLDKALDLAKEKDQYANTNPDVLFARAQAKGNLRDLRGALKDVEEVLTLDPKRESALYFKGCLLFCEEDFKASDAFESLRDSERATEGYGKFAALYLYFVAVQAKEDKSAEAALRIAGEKLEEGWPLPLLQFVKGDTDEATVLKTAATPGQKTEARCAMGIHWMLAGKADAAKKHFEWVKENGAATFFDYTIAVNLLARMEKK